MKTLCTLMILILSRQASQSGGESQQLLRYSHSRWSGKTHAQDPAESGEHYGFKALEINSNRASTYCKKLENDRVQRINDKKPKTKEAAADEWYKNYGGSRTGHYNPSRYHGLNLHAVFTKGTVEFRLFNSTTHAGKLKA